LADPGAQFKGPIPNERVGEVLADSDVVVVPSLWYENSPVVIQEARAARVPVIASGHGAMAEKCDMRSMACCSRRAARRPCGRQYSV